MNIDRLIINKRTLLERNIANCALTTLTAQMGAIFSKLCFTCCGGNSKKSKSTNSHFHSINHSKSSSKLSKNPSLIIQRSHVFRDVEEEGSEYTRVLERDFEIWGRRLVDGTTRTSSALSNLNGETTRYSFRENVANHPVTIIDSSNDSLEVNLNDSSEYPKKVHHVIVIFDCSNHSPFRFFKLDTRKADRFLLSPA